MNGSSNNVTNGTKINGVDMNGNHMNGKSVKPLNDNGSSKFITCLEDNLNINAAVNKVQRG